MTSTDYLINFILIGLVFLQIRDRRLTTASLVRPVLLVAAAALYYLKGFPTAGHDVALYLVLAAIGLVLGAVCGATTHVWHGEDGFTHTKAGVTAAIFWVVGIGSRLAFEEYSLHGGETSIAHFSAVHQITGENAWIAGLVLMALCEVLARLAVIQLRKSTRATSAPVGEAAAVAY